MDLARTRLTKFPAQLVYAMVLKEIARVDLS